MPYEFNEEAKAFTNTEGGICAMFRMRDRARDARGSLTMSALTDGIYTGSNWDSFACVDRLVELHELREVHVGASAAPQNRQFIFCR